MEDLTNHRHFVVHKPYGMLSQFVRIGKRKKRLLGELHNFPEGTMSIGRLDEHSEGLLLLTTDGKVSHHVRSKDVEKEYYVQVDGNIHQDALDLLSNGVQITVEGQPFTTLPGKAKLLQPIPDFPPRIRKIRDDRHGPTSWVAITIKEGKNRQVRKMTAAVGFPTLRLMRVRIGPIHLGSLTPEQVYEVPHLNMNPS